MRIALAVIAVLATSARADDRVYEVGMGAPGGITFGLGVRAAGWQAVLDGGGGTLGPAGLLTGSVHLHRDVVTGRQSTLAVGGSASWLGFLVGGGDTTSTGSVELAGPSIEGRYKVAPHRALVLEVGALFGRCRGDCDPRPFLMPGVTVRVDWGH
jgi:hypothetical protein